MNIIGNAGSRTSSAPQHEAKLLDRDIGGSQVQTAWNRTTAGFKKRHECNFFTEDTSEEWADQESWLPPKMRGQMQLTKPLDRMKVLQKSTMINMPAGFWNSAQESTDVVLSSPHGQSQLQRSPHNKIADWKARQDRKERQEDTWETEVDGYEKEIKEGQREQEEKKKKKETHNTSEMAPGEEQHVAEEEMHFEPHAHYSDDEEVILTDLLGRSEFPRCMGSGESRQGQLSQEASALTQAEIGNVGEIEEADGLPIGEGNVQITPSPVRGPWEDTFTNAPEVSTPLEELLDVTLLPQRFRAWLCQTLWANPWLGLHGGEVYKMLVWIKGIPGSDSWLEACVRCNSEQCLRWMRHVDWIVDADLIYMHWARAQ